MNPARSQIAGALPGTREHLERFRAADRATLAAVYRHYVDDVEAVLLHGFVFTSHGDVRRFGGLRNPADVEDRLHDVFARAFGDRARSAYDGLSDYRPYLLAIARNVVLGRLRSSAERVAREAARLDAEPEGPTNRLDELLAAADADRTEPSAPGEHEEIAAVAQAFLDGLGETDRAVLDHRFRQRRPQAEIAAALGMSAPTLRKHERRIFRGFFAHMQRHGYFEHHRPRGDLRARRDVVLLALLALLQRAAEEVSRC